MLVEARAGGIELAHAADDRTFPGEQMREAATGHARTPRQAVAVGGPDRVTDRRLGAWVAELGPERS